MAKRWSTGSRMNVSYQYSQEEQITQDGRVISRSKDEKRYSGKFILQFHILPETQRRNGITTNNWKTFSLTYRLVCGIICPPN